MKTKNKEEAKGFARAQSLHKDHEDTPVYIIHATEQNISMQIPIAPYGCGSKLSVAMSMGFLQSKNNIHKKHKTQKS